jgi:uncharacterized phage protein gp47/JayE
VGVFIVSDLAPGGPIPEQGLLDEVQAYIEARAPVTADVYALAPVAAELDITLEIEPDTAALRATIEAELVDMLHDEAEPGAALYLAQLHRALAAADGWTNYTLVVPAADVAHAPNELAVPGTVSWD